MPGLQVVDLSPKPRTEETNLEKTLGGFAKRQRENQLQQDENDALREIYGQFQQDGNNILEQRRKVITNPRLSPTTRVNTLKHLDSVAKYNEKLEKKAKIDAEKAEKKAANQNVLSDLETRRGLAPGTLNAYAEDPKMAEQVTRPGKTPTVNQADRPIDKEQLKRIQHVESKPEFKSGSPSEKGKLLRDNGVSEKNTEGVIKPYIEEAKIANERTSILTKKQAENDVAFVDEQAAKYPSLVNRQQTVEAADILNEKGVTGQPWDQAMQKAGLLQYTSEGFREFSSYAKEMVKNSNIKSVIGSQISQMEFGFFRDATISERFSKEANRQIIKKEKLAIRYDKLYADITKKKIEENGGKIPEGIQRQVNEEFAKQSEKISNELRKTAIDFEAIQNVPKGKVLMYDKKRRPLHVPANEVEKYSKPPYGATLS